MKIAILNIYIAGAQTGLAVMHSARGNWGWFWVDIALVIICLAFGIISITQQHLTGGGE